MRIRIFDVAGLATKQFRAECDLEDAFPDDVDGCTLALLELTRTGRHSVGGGAAPLVLLERVD